MAQVTKKAVPKREGLGLEVTFFFLALFCFSVGWVRSAVRSGTYELNPRQAGTIRIVTWNVGTGLENPGLPEEHLQHVADVLKEIDADLVFLQEVLSKDLGNRLVERLGEEWSSEGFAGALSLAQRGRLRSFHIEDGFRLRSIGIRYRSEEGERIAAVGIHAPAFSAEKRNLAIGKATEALLERRESKKILAGDLNLEVAQGKRGDLLSNNDPLDVETYNFVAERLRDLGLNGGPTAEPDRRLDYIFCSEEWNVIAAGVLKGRRAPGMDHDPFVADLR